MKEVLLPAMASGFVCALLLLPGCAPGGWQASLPDAGVEMADRRGELIIQSWEGEMGRIAKGCRLRLAGFACPF